VSLRTKTGASNTSAITLSMAGFDDAPPVANMRVEYPENKEF